MLAKRIIPCLDVRQGRVVKGKRFQAIEDVEDPVVLADRYCREGADELVFYDITASAEDRGIFDEVVRRVSKVVNIPLTVGGGIATVEDFTRVLMAGADKVSVNTAAVRRPELIREAALKFGAQCVVLSVDVSKVGPDRWEVVVKGGRETTGMSALDWIKQGVALGAGEVVVNSIDQDGVRKGYDVEFLKQVTAAVNVPVIASGGAGALEHFEEAARVADVDGILAASVFHYGDISIGDLKSYLLSHGVAVRPLDHRFDRTAADAAEQGGN
jgi:imidazole glycerol-phosphate synthase subunit HisF